MRRTSIEPSDDRIEIWLRAEDDAVIMIDGESVGPSLNPNDAAIVARWLSCGFLNKVSPKASTP